MSADLRPARPGDAAAIAGLARALAAHHGDAPAATAESVARDAFGPEPWVHLVVAETGAGIIGYAALCRSVSLPFGQRHAEIRDLFVAPDHRGRGIGAALVADCARIARGWSCETLTVSAHPGNVAAQAFHVAQGFARRDSRAPRFVMDL